MFVSSFILIKTTWNISTAVKRIFTENKTKNY